MKTINICLISLMLLQIVGEALDIYPIRLLKPIPIIIMILNTPSGQTSTKMIKYGLCFSVIGDILLMFSSLEAFMTGTGFFLIAHVLYCIAFFPRKMVRYIPESYIVRIQIFCVFLIGLFLFNIYSLWDVMPSKFLFTLYGFILLCMNICACTRYHSTSSQSYWPILYGAVMFGLSDNLLAMLKFNGHSNTYGRAAVMFLYYFGQYLIMEGAIEHHEMLKQSKKAKKQKD